jgi:autotransporter-associated beta strand protein
VISRRHKALATGTLSICVAGVLGSSVAQAQVRAFGDAEGVGAVATGGRTGTIYHVTNLNNSGAGSFRDAVGGSNRIIVFDVGGVINLTSAVSAQSNLTILGQTAPGGGITINGYQGISFAQRTNVIMRHLRFRPGDSSPGSDDCISLYKTGTAILDHISAEFGKYNNIDAVADTADRPLITIQHSIIADPISNGSSTTGQGFGAHLEAVNGYYTLSNNLWASSHNRNPLAKVNDQFKNNIEYNNEAGYTTHTSTPFKHDLVNNAFIWGPSSNSNSDYYQLSDGDTFYAAGNVKDTNKNGVFDGVSDNPVNGTTGANLTVVANPNFATTTSLPTLSVTDAYAYVITHAGASLVRDQLDQQVISQVQSLGTQGPVGLYQSAAEDGLPNGGLGTIAGASRPAGFDADNDGVADAWEATHGMSASNGADSLLLNPLGYRMVEQYANELADQNSTAAWANPAVAPGAYTHATVRGTGAANGSLTISTTPAVPAAPQAMTLSIGGGGPAAGETVTVTSGGRLNVYDTITVGEFNNAALNVNGGYVSTWNVQLGNTDFSGGGAGVSYTGTLNLTGGTLALSQIVRGAGTVGNWNTGGQLNWSGGTILALGTLNISVPMSLSGTGDTLNTNGFDGQINGNMSGAGTLTKTGAGTLTLVGNNSAFSGPIKLNAGALTLGTNSSNSPTGLITAANGTQLNVTASGASTPLALANGATVTLSAGGLTYNGAISGAVGTTLIVSNSSTGTSNFSIGGNLTAFAGTLDLGASTGNIRIGSSGSSLASFDAGDSTGTIRTSFDGTTNFGSLAGGAGTHLQGSTNGTVASTYVIGANGNSTTFAGTIEDGTNATPAVLNITKTGTGILTLTNTASKYTGVTTINGGMLSVPALFNGGATSPIGDSTSAAANLVLDGGTLRYTGGAGGATDRAFTVGPAGGAIDSSGGGAIDFNGGGSVVASAAGDRTLTFRGNNTGANYLRLNLADPAGGGKLSITKDGSGTWRLAGTSSSYTGGTTVNAGKLIATSGSAFGTSALSVATGATTQAQPGLSSALVLASVTTAGSGQLDLADNAAVIRSMTIPQVQALLATGFAGGAWNGPGINSSTAAADAAHVTTIGFAGNAVLNKTAFKGVSPLTAGDVLLKYTYYGDADLNGATTLDDFTLFLAGYQNGGTTWVQGDFDYNGLTTLDDFTLFLKGYQQQGAPLSAVEALVNSVPMTSGERAAMLAAVAAVPEPAGLATATFALAAAALGRRRRREHVGDQIIA